MKISIMKFTILSIVCMLVYLSACFSTSPEVPKGKIAFLSSGREDDKEHIYIMDNDGSNVERLETGLEEDGCPVWSPDGSRILFISSNGNEDLSSNQSRYSVKKYQIYIFDLRKSELIQLKDIPGVFSTPDWSPRGDKIILTVFGDNTVDLVVLDVEREDVFSLLSVRIAMNPLWSPDGQKVVMTSHVDEGRTESRNLDVVIFDIDGSNLMRLTDDPSLDFINSPPYDYAQSWSPDGQKIAYITRTFIIEEGKGERISASYSNIKVLDLDSGNIIQLTNAESPENNLNPEFSPNGEKIIFSSNRDHLDNPDVYDIYVMDNDGTNVSRLTFTGNNQCPNWQP